MTANGAEHVTLCTLFLASEQLHAVSLCINTSAAAAVQITMSGISTLTSGQAQWRELHTLGYNPLLLASQVDRCRPFHMLCQLQFLLCTAPHHTIAL